MDLGCEIMPLRNLIENDINRNPVLVERSKVNIISLNERTLEGVASLYRNAYETDPWFFCGNLDPNKTFLSLDWLRDRIVDPNHVMMVFTGLEGEVLGSTSLIRSED